jgi:hypothetical protein
MLARRLLFKLVCFWRRAVEEWEMKDEDDQTLANTITLFTKALWYIINDKTLFCLRVIGHLNINVDPFTGTHPKGRHLSFILSYIIKDKTDFPFPRGLYIIYIVHPSLFILGIGVCVRVPPVDFVRFNKIILVWLGSGRYGWHPAMALALLLAHWLWCLSSQESQ